MGETVRKSGKNLFFDKKSLAFIELFILKEQVKTSLPLYLPLRSRQHTSILTSALSV